MNKCYNCPHPPHEGGCLGEHYDWCESCEAAGDSLGCCSFTCNCWTLKATPQEERRITLPQDRDKAVKLIDHVKGQVHFDFYREGELWYRTDTNFYFPVPISEADTAVFSREDKAILFMRYIRKHMEVIDQAVKEATGENK